MPTAPGRRTGETPRIAITPGEPAGIGPDLLVALAQHGHPAELIAVADPDLLTTRAAMLGLPLVLDPWDATLPAQPQRPGRLRCLAAARLSAPVEPGRLDPANARYVLATLAAAADGCLRGDFAAMVTAPVHKGVINDAGLAFSGHTEFLAGHCDRWLGRSANSTAGAPANPADAAIEPVMLLTAPGLRVALATTHLPLAAVPAALSAPRLERVLTTLAQALQSHFGIPRPRILVCGLNPHAGEGGHLGHEEQAIIIPVLDALRATGLDLIGPLPADTAFVPSRLAGADAVLAMYHDQGLPVLKHLGFGQAVNVTLGLPIIRTSVDHGTALDLAGSGRADLGSLRAALALALEMTGAVGGLGK